jgi:pimeloyl-ACP methyl ester carboxylesterase
VQVDMTIETAVGQFAGIDFGGRGPDVLLVHGTGHNSAVWAPVAEHLAPHCRVVAIDLRGHGRTPLDSSDAEQYWRDLGPLCAALGCRRPILAGHSTGGYAVTAAAAAGVADPAGVCVLDGFVPESRAIAQQAAVDVDWPAMASQLRAMFRYGWITGEEELAGYVEQVVADAGRDSLDAGADQRVLRAMTIRGFTKVEAGWLRRPTLTEIDTVRQPPEDAGIYPSIEVYDRVPQPMALVLASEGFYASRRERVEAVAAARANRVFVEVPGGHNVHLLRPREVARVVLDLLARASEPSASS